MYFPHNKTVIDKWETPVFCPSLMPALKLLGWKAGPVSLGEAGGGFPALPPPWCGGLREWAGGTRLCHRSPPESAWALLCLELEGSEVCVMDSVSRVCVTQG